MTTGSGSRGSLLRQTATSYMALDSSAPNHSSYLANNILNLVHISTIEDGSGTAQGKTTYGYDESAPVGSGVTTQHNSSPPDGSYRGNQTSVDRWLNGGTDPKNTTAYFDTGMKDVAKDPKTNPTTYGYGTNAYVTTDFKGAYVTSITNALNQVEYFNYAFDTGSLTDHWDLNLQKTAYSYDSMRRVTTVNYPESGLTTYNYNSDLLSSSYWACTSHSTSVLEVTVSKSITSTVTLRTNALFDQLGRPVQTQVASDPSGTDCTDTTYDSLGRVSTVSNPYRATSDPTYGIATSTYDGLGRTTNVNHQDNNNTTTPYSANCATVTNPSGNARKMCNDGLGRLTQVYEDPGSSPHKNYLTSYTYNVFDDLLTVVQGTQKPCGGSYSRQFIYDSLSRLAAACNPESGTTSYTYDANGNVTKRTDARSVSTTYGYDDLNRVTSKSYSDGFTPPVTFAYDAASITLGGQNLTSSNPVGRMIAAYTTGSSGQLLSATANSYDKVGRISGQSYCMPYYCAWQPASFLSSSYTYDLAGDVYQSDHNGFWNPVNFTVTQTLDGAQRVTSVTSSFYDNLHPENLAQSISYTPFGAIKSLTNGCAGTGGNNCSNSAQEALETYDYNNRLQLVRTQLGTAASGQSAQYNCKVHDYYQSSGNASACTFPYPSSPPTSGDSGNVWGYWYSNSNTTFDHSATFGYDSVNRLTSAAATGNSTYSLSFSYTGDGSTGQYGNMQCTGSAGCTSGLTFSASSNHITTSGYSYDAAGNVLSDGGFTYQYDGEGRLISLDGQPGQACASGAVFCNTYDAFGRVVEETLPVWLNGSQTSNTTVSDIGYDPWGQRHNFVYGSAAGGYNADEFISTMPGGRAIAYYNENNVRGTYFEHPDALGTVTEWTDSSGNVAIGNQKFYPWGEAWGGQVAWFGDPNFAGMEHRNAEGFDVTPNRQYNPAIGRWMTPDPSNLSVDFWMPQTWNRYSYALNNPLSIVDRNGLWPTYIHNDIINEAFPGMSAEDLKILTDASHSMDYGPGQQTAALSFEHGMRNGMAGQTASEAEAQSDAFIAQNEHDAARIQADWIASGHSGIAPAALTAFGNALHTIEDRLSPAHAGFQPWYGQSWWNPSAWRHYLREAHISPAQMNSAVSAARQAFQQTFGTGWDEFDLMRLQMQQEQGVATHQLCFTDDNGNMVCR